MHRPRFFNVCKGCGKTRQSTYAASDRLCNQCAQKVRRGTITVDDGEMPKKDRGKCCRDLPKACDSCFHWWVTGERRKPDGQKYFKQAELGTL